MPHRAISATIGRVARFGRGYCLNDAMSSVTVKAAVPPKAILFDLDDTLWPIAPVIVAAETLLHDWLLAHAPRVAQQFSIEALRQARLAMLQQQPAYHGNLIELRRAGLLSAFEAVGEDVALVDAAVQQFLAARHRVTLYDDVLPGLAWMGQRLLVGSISNGNADLEIIGLAQHFRISIAASDFGVAKPDTSIFLAGCKALGVAPHEAVYVGDDLYFDVTGAQDAGMRAVWMNRKGSDAHLAAGVQPDAICANFDELLLWLQAQLED